VATLDRALAEHRRGHALARAFHVDSEIFEHELERIWRRSWLYAGPVAACSEPGQYFRFDLGDDSLIIVRDERRELHALHNTCRHRGMPVCGEQHGRATRWVCPYHQWSYRLDGELLGSGGMERELGGGDYNLRRAGIHELGGLVFVWAGEDPEPLGAAQVELGAALAPQGLDRAKVAHEIDYRVAANWKLVWENNRECWHCHSGHPQYVRANFDSVPDNARTRELALSRAAQHARSLGAPTGTDEHAQPGLYGFPDPGRWWSANRTPMAPGFVTESLDGAPVAPLMGGYADYDVGTLRVRTVPNLWVHASSDHAVVTRLVATGPQCTQVTVQWLVDAGAIEGRDYTLDRLLPFWQLTSEQDWDLCERNQAGVRSPAYVPGPYSRTREYNVAAFVDWYLERIGG
jgi:Rieske 2Fe-2S family protein